MTSYGCHVLGITFLSTSIIYREISVSFQHLIYPEISVSFTKTEPDVSAASCPVWHGLAVKVEKWENLLLWTHSEHFSHSFLVESITTSIKAHSVRHTHTHHLSLQPLPSTVQAINERRREIDLSNLVLFDNTVYLVRVVDLHKVSIHASALFLILVTFCSATFPCLNPLPFFLSSFLSFFLSFFLFLPPTYLWRKRGLNNSTVKQHRQEKTHVEIRQQLQHWLQQYKSTESYGKSFFLR